MSDNDIQDKPNPRRVDDHVAAAASPEKHLLDAHKLYIQIQGKEGSRGHGVWSLIREGQGNVKTLSVFEGTRLEAAHYFFQYIHHNKIATPSVQTRQSKEDSRPSPQSGRSQGRTSGRPQGRS